MPRIPYLMFGLTLCACSSLCACTSMSNCEYRRAVCNEIRSQLVFNGATSITRQAEIENAAMPLQQRAYFANHCDQF